MSWIHCRKSSPPKNEKTDLVKARDLKLITEKEFLKLTAERANATYDRYLDLEKLKTKTKKK